jgi:hypothetical protein
MLRFLRAQMRRLSRTVERGSLDLLDTPSRADLERQPARARRVRVSGTRIVVVSWALFVAAGLLHRTGWIPGPVADCVRMAAFGTFSAGLQRHGWATGYTTRHLQGQLMNLHALDRPRRGRHHQDGGS